jgi:hypothetical protein
MLFALMETGTTKEARQIAKEEIARMAGLADEYVKAQKRIPEQPQIEDFSTGLDLRNPLEASAYLKAAGHFLSSWPQDWSAERLCLALVDEESADRAHVQCWQALTKDVDPINDAHFFVEELINGLAEDFLMFAKKISG